MRSEDDGGVNAVRLNATAEWDAVSRWGIHPMMHKIPANHEPRSKPTQPNPTTTTETKNYDDDDIVLSQTTEPSWEILT